MIKYGLVYNRKNILGKDGRAIVQLRAYHPGLRKNKFINTNIRLEPKQWDKRKERVTPNHAKYITLNNHFKDLISKLEEFEIGFLEKDKECTLEMVERFLRGQNPVLTFNDFVERELENSTLRASTIKQQRVFLNKLNEFRSNLLFSEIDYEFCCQFEFFLKNKGLGKNSIHKEFKNFKKFLNEAVKKGVFSERKNPFEVFKVKTTATDKVYLTEAEIARIETLELYDRFELIAIRDLYLFGVYTGLRFSDVMSLTNGAIIRAESNGWVLKIRMNKTEDGYLYQ